MTSLEDRLRRDLCAQAEQITPPGVPRLRLPGPAGRRGRRPWHRGPRRRPAWVTPLAAAVAVAAVLIGIFAAAQAVRHRVPRHRPPASVSGRDGLPRYYVSLPRGWRSSAVVAKTATGAMIATLHAPRPFAFEDDNIGDCSQSLSAAGDRAFVLMAAGPPPRVIRGPVRLFLLRVTPTGGTSLTALRLPERLGNNQSVCYALSPDGRRLALTFAPNPYEPYKSATMVVQVITLATGQVRQWSYTNTLRGDPVRDLTWVTPRTLAFYVPLNAPDAPTTTAPPRQDTPGTYLLDTAAPGHNLLADSRRLTGELFEARVATPDGTRLIGNQYAKASFRAVLTEVSVRTGKVVRTFGACVHACTDGAEAVLWSDPSGNRLIVAKAVKFPMPGPPVYVIGTLTPGGAFTPLRPQPQAQGQPPGLAW